MNLADPFAAFTLGQVLGDPPPSPRVTPTWSGKFRPTIWAEVDVAAAHRARERREAMCESKKRYDKRGAQSAINLIQRTGRARHMRAYACPICQGWHIARNTNDHEN